MKTESRIQLLSFVFLIVGPAGSLFGQNAAFTEFKTLTQSLLSTWNSEVEGEGKNKKLTYDWGGYINTEGELAGSRLGIACSAYVAPVLIALLKDSKYSLLKAEARPEDPHKRVFLHQWFGEDIADHLELRQVLSWASINDFQKKLSDPEAFQSGVYLFDLKSPKASNRSYKDEGGPSHTEFLTMEWSQKDNRWRVRDDQFSELNNGHRTGLFQDYLKNSLYRDFAKSQIALWRVK